MLQRIQSIYLLFASLVLLGLFVFPLAHNIYIDGKDLDVTIMGIFQNVNGKRTQTETFTALAVLTGLLALVPLAIIFQYKNRKLQATLCYSTILALIGYSFWMAQTVKKAVGPITLGYANMGIGLFLTSLSILLLIFAAKAISKDEKLVRSADRLR